MSIVGVGTKINLGHAEERFSARFYVWQNRILFLKLEDYFLWFVGSEKPYIYSVPSRK